MIVVGILGVANLQGGQYTVTELGNLGGQGHIIAHSINNDAQITGEAYNAQQQLRAFLWQNGAMIDLGTLGGAESMGHAINSAGAVAGASMTADGQVRAFIYHNGVMQDLGFQVEWGLMMGINDLNQVTGRQTATQHAFLYSGQLPPIDIPTLGGVYGHGIHVTAQGHVVGDAQYLPFNKHRGFYWDGSLTALEFMPGGDHAGAYHANHAGQIVGWSYAGDGYRHPVLWNNKNELPLDLGTLGGNNGSAIGINNVGQIVGMINTTDGQDHAFIWEQGVMRDLNALIPAEAPYDYLRRADSINDQGEIVCQAIVGAQYRAILLRPIATAIDALIDVAPDTLNLRSRGQWITAYITLPATHSVSLIDVSTVKISALIGSSCPIDYNQPIDVSFTPTIGDYDEDLIPDLHVKFDRQILLANVCLDDINIRIEGKLFTGERFVGEDTIRIHNSGQ